MSNTKYADLAPIRSVSNRQEYMQALDAEELAQAAGFERSLITASPDAFTVTGYSAPCAQEVEFLVDMNYGGRQIDGLWVPNWRERLECPICHMNNRQRLISTLLKRRLDGDTGCKIYFMEQVTPIYKWACENFSQHEIIGSEYLGFEYESGTVIEGIRHEDIESMSFDTDSLDMIVSNDVFEHVPNPLTAFSECARVLKPDGMMLATMPFNVNSDVSVTRASIQDGELIHHESPEYHGNPISTDGSLVFTDFGWELIGQLKEAGFSDVKMGLYSSIEFGHLGGLQIIFECTK